MEGERAHAVRAGGRHRIRRLLLCHRHDLGATVDDALVASAEGIRAVKVSLAMLVVLIGVQGMVAAISGSVALLTEAVHHAADLLTAPPLWVALALSRRPATRRFPYGYGRAEDLAGLFIAVVIAGTGVSVAWHSIQRLQDPPSLQHVWLVAAAGVIGAVGNELIARYRIRVGRRIGSEAMVAEGLHARTDSIISLGVVVGAMAAGFGVHLADPVVGLLIAAMVVTTAVRIGVSFAYRLMDGMSPQLADRLREVVVAVPEVCAVAELRVTAVGHCHRVEAIIDVPGELTFAQAKQVRQRVERNRYVGESRDCRR